MVGLSIKMNMKTLSEVKVGQWLKIVGFAGEGDGVQRRFLELGFVPGESVRVVAKSLQKKVLLVEVKGYLLSVRTDLLQKVQVM